MRKTVLISVVGVVLVAGSAFGDPPPPPPPPPHAAAAPIPPVVAPVKAGGTFGPAGCGLGSLIFEPNSGFTQIVAATTNGTSANQTFAISSGTSNCDTGPASGASAKVFVTANREALSKDIAKGSGETIDSLSTLAGCADSKAVGTALQKNFKTIFPSAAVSSDAVGDSVLSTLKSDKSLACSKVST
jgi:hypothetical protein